MGKISRSRDPRYMEIFEGGVRKYVRDPGVLADEIFALLIENGELSRSKICLLAGASPHLVDRALVSLMSGGRATKVRRQGAQGQHGYFWSASGQRSETRVDFKANGILAAFRREGDVDLI
jgi:hypothetical protein